MTISASSLNFSSAALFSANVNPEQIGRIIRVSTNDTVVSPGVGDLPVKAGGVLFKNDKTGALSFHDSGAFNADFSRLLSNGATVPLSKPTSIQLLEIREAEDKAHLADIATVTGRAALAKGTKAVNNLWGRAAATETGRNVGEIVNEARTQGVGFLNDAADQLNQALNSPTADKVRENLNNFKGRLKKLAWGKVDNKS